MKKIGIYVGIVLLFLVLAYGFVPEVLTGKIVNQSDITGYRSMSQEAVAWNNTHPDDPTYWTDSMFGGMPTTSFVPSSDGDWTQSLYSLLMKGKRPANWLFISLLGAFLLMLSLGVDKVLAIGGAVAITYCSYNFQIIQVGHNTKMQAIAFLPWALAAVIFTYRSALRPWLGSSLRQAQGPNDAVAEPVEATKGWKYWLPKTLLGAVLFGFALSFQIKANHQQITYYLAIMIVIYALYVFLRICLEKTGHFGKLSDRSVVEPVETTVVREEETTGSSYRKTAFGRFFAASVLLLVVGFAGIGTNTIKLAPLYEYTKYTMRGGSELSHPEGGEINNTGLQLDYATAWSYGWEELPNLMIPNFNGGSSAGSMNPDKSEVVKLFRQAGQGNANEIAKSLPLYWGPQPFTVGKRYLNSDSFTTPRQFNNQFTARQVDKLILEDKAPSYRIVDLSADIFNDSFNPYWHKCIGGYSPAKLQRYQDLIDRHIVKELQAMSLSTRGAKTIEEFQSGLKNIQVLSALNTKYFILGADMPPVENLEAFGPAWFVDSFVPAETPDEEIALIDSVNLRRTAVIGSDFAEARECLVNVSASGSVDVQATDFIRMTSYAPNELHYHYSASVARTAIFSEIYYPDGWTATVDGAPLDLFRADWIFRAANLPAGEHDIVMRFEPKAYSIGAKASRASSLTLFILLALSLAGLIFSRRSN